MFSFPNLSNHAVLSTRSLKPLQSGIQRFILANTNFCHLHFPPFAATAEADHPQSFSLLLTYTTDGPDIGTSGYYINLSISNQLGFYFDSVSQLPDMTIQPTHRF